MQLVIISGGLLSCVQPSLTVGRMKVTIEDDMLLH